MIETIKGGKYDKGNLTETVNVKKGLNHISARMTLWPETVWPGQFGQNDTLDRVTFWTE